MEKEILFKALRQDGKGWVEGEPLTDTSNIDQKGMLPKGSDDIEEIIMILPQTLCIGVNYKGAWIFSGDEMNHPDLGIGIVSFNGFGFMITYPDEDNYCLPLHEDISELQLTGNNINDKLWKKED